LTTNINILNGFLFSYDFPSQRPVIKVYMERVKKAVGPAYDDAHKIARKVANAMAQSKL